MSAMSPIETGSTSYDRLKNLVSFARERCVRAACAAWNKDAENCKMLEDWTRDPERRELTKMPGFFVAFESSVLSGMQKILYISEAMSKAGSVDVVTPPPAKLLQMVRTQFVTSVYKALSGLVENAERPVKMGDEEDWTLKPTVPVRSIDAASTIITTDNVDARNRVS
jgi:exocyst complex component 2